MNENKLLLIKNCNNKEREKEKMVKVLSYNIDISYCLFKTFFLVNYET